MVSEIISSPGIERDRVNRQQRNNRLKALGLCALTAALVAGAAWFATDMGSSTSRAMEPYRKNLSRVEALYTNGKTNEARALANQSIRSLGNYLSGTDGRDPISFSSEPYDLIGEFREYTE